METTAREGAHGRQQHVSRGHSQRVRRLLRSNLGPALRCANVCANFPRRSCTFSLLRACILHHSPSHSPLKPPKCSPAPSRAAWHRQAPDPAYPEAYHPAGESAWATFGWICRERCGRSACTNSSSRTGALSCGPAPGLRWSICRRGGGEGCDSNLCRRAIRVRVLGPGRRPGLPDVCVDDQTLGDIGRREFGATVMVRGLKDKLDEKSASEQTQLSRSPRRLSVVFAGYIYERAVHPILAWAVLSNPGSEGGHQVGPRGADISCGLRAGHRISASRDPLEGERLASRRSEGLAGADHSWCGLASRSRP